ncbi:hypothetical protein BGZ73_008378, partial [Actinomortierella ambigua]
MGWSGSGAASTAKSNIINTTAASSSHHHTLGHQSEPESEGSARLSPLFPNGAGGTARSRCSSSSSGSGGSTSMAIGSQLYRAPGTESTKGKATNLNGQVTSDPSQLAVLVRPVESTPAALTVTNNGCENSNHNTQQQHRQQTPERSASGVSDSTRISTPTLCPRPSSAVHVVTTAHSDNVDSIDTVSSHPGPDRGWSHISEFLMALMSQSLASRIFARRPQWSS